MRIADFSVFFLAIASSGLGACASAPALVAETCWVEYSAGDVPSALAAAGLTTPIWHTTTSGLLIRHPHGHVLVDAGWSHSVVEATAELTDESRPMSIRIMNSVAWRSWTPAALALVGEAPSALSYVLPTHAHFDHMAGAEDLPSVPVLLSPTEIAFLDEQERVPTIVSPSNIRAIRNRIEPLAFEDGQYLGFARSHDVFGDGAIVVVPLPGHTPGSGRARPIPVARMRELLRHAGYA